MTIADKYYKELILKIHNEGTWDKDQKVRPKYEDGTPAYTKSIFGHQVVFEEGEVPLITCKRMFPITAMKELYLFWIKQSVKKEDFDQLNCKIWDEWMFSQGPYKGTLGKSYAYQFTASDGRNQVKDLLYNIQNNPSSRRLMTSFWNYNDIQDKALQECAMQTTWNVREGKLDLILYSRSLDVGLGCGFNWYQYYGLLLFISHCTGLKPGRFIHQIGNAHYYDRHEEPLLSLLDYREFETPSVKVREDAPKDFFEMSYQDLILENYNHGPVIPLEVAI